MIPTNLQTLKVLSAQDLNLKIELMKLDVFIQRFLPGQELSGQVVKNFPGNRAVVNFSGEHVLLQMDRPTRAGDTLSVKVENSQPSPTLRRIESPPSQQHRNNLINTRSNDTVELQRPRTHLQKIENPISTEHAKSLGLKMGQNVEGSITRVIDQNTVAINAKNQSLTLTLPADLAGKVKEGQNLSVTLRSIPNSNQLSLVIEKPVPGILDASRLQEYLPARTALSNTLSGLNRALGELSLQSQDSIPQDLLSKLTSTTDRLFLKDTASIDASSLKELVSRSGINYESHLRNTLIGDKGVPQSLEYLKSDAKGQLLSLSNQLSNVSKDNGSAPQVLNELKNLAGQVRSALQNIELQQLSQNLARQENQPMVLQIPNQLFGEDHTLQLFVRKESDSNDSNISPDKKSWNLVFFLDLTALGSLRVDTKIHEEQVEIKISSENETILTYMKSQFPALEKNLDEMGFHASLSGELAHREEMEIMDPLDLYLQTDPNRLVDIKT